MKINPRKRPANQADVERAKKEAMSIATDYALCIFFTVLRDKEGYGIKRLQRLYSHINTLSQAIEQGYVSLPDLKRTLKEEAGIEFV